MGKIKTKSSNKYAYILIQEVGFQVAYHGPYCLYKSAACITFTNIILNNYRRHQEPEEKTLRNLVVVLRKYVELKMFLTILSSQKLLSKKHQVLFWC